MESLSNKRKCQHLAIYLQSTWLGREYCISDLPNTLMEDRDLIVTTVLYHGNGAEHPKGWRKGYYLLVKEVTTAPQHAAIMRWRCLLFPDFFLLLFLPLATAADEDSGMLVDDEELGDEVGRDELVLAVISAGMLSVAMMVALL